VNGIHEVRGSIPLASTLRSCSVGAYEVEAVAKGRASRYNPARFAGIAQLVEHNLAKVGVAGSSPVSRSRRQSLGSRVEALAHLIIGG
jgi:hypothetical protein